MSGTDVSEGAIGPQASYRMPGTYAEYCATVHCGRPPVLTREILVPGSAIPTNAECPAGRYCPGGFLNA
eukprot:2728044-Rhodomonas_salina.1